ncbi:hypothetical protein [Leifsonia sp. NPDC077715]|uniref:hypothetical protein n=1 Tax=Leifsonia sp. NPDC077715 TaxID=3155539 RepID=UPI003426344B
MSETVSVDTSRLTANAEALAAANAPERRPLRSEGPLGSSRCDGAFESFDRYWDPATEALLFAIDALSVALRDTARAYELRDALGARTFDKGIHAF